MIGDDGLVIVYWSDQSGGVGGRDLYIGTRSVNTDPFSNVSNIGDLNTIGDEQELWSNADMSYILFASDRAGGATSIYETRVIP